MTFFLGHGWPKEAGPLTLQTFSILVCWEVRKNLTYGQLVNSQELKKRKEIWLIITFLMSRWEIPQHMLVTLFACLINTARQIGVMMNTGRSTNVYQPKNILPSFPLHSQISLSRVSSVCPCPPYMPSPGAWGSLLICPLSLGKVVFLH